MKFEWDEEKNIINEYSCAMKSHFRKSGNQMSGKWKSSYASYSRNALSKPYTSRIEMSCWASMLVMLMR